MMQPALQACKAGAISVAGFYLYSVLVAHSGTEGCAWSNAELARWLPAARSARRVQQLLAELRASGLVVVQVHGNARRIYLETGMQAESDVRGEAPFQDESGLPPVEQARLMRLLMRRGYGRDEARQVLVDHVTDLRRAGIPEERIADLLVWRVEYATPVRDRTCANK